ncbi:hypothetical protein K8W59_15935 [Nocardioides rotundus]|uniref:FtsX-like permease family protein n=1 Tax=Nocardioides rotundus TaxID=1774216 RepID=UPI001CC08EDD|nr:FtsX-like permease family protein [Nocardioides rotundus]UAL29246.1 hypothetical protein K8W59_15935 [Nocardioides rotundus]
MNVLIVCALVSGLGSSLGLISQQALTSSLSALPPEDTTVTVTSTYDEDDPAAQDRAVRDALAPVVAQGGAVVTALASGTFDRAGGAPRGADAPDAPVVFAAVAGADPVIGAGRAPRAGPDGPDRLEVLAPQGTAEPGDRLRLTGRLGQGTVDATVVGTWAADDERALGTVDPTALLVAPEAFPAVAGTDSEVAWRAVPSLSLSADRFPQLSDGVAEALDAIEVVDADIPASVSAESGLREAIADRTEELAVLRGLLLAPVAMLVLVALAGLVLVAAGLAEVRGEEESLWRSRGATRRQLIGPTVLENLLICGTAAAFGPLLASVAIRIGDVRPPLSASAWVASAVAALCCAVALSAPALLRALGGDRGEQLDPQRQRRRRLTAQVALLMLVAILGVLGVVTLRGYADRVASGATGLDPLVVAGPALVLVAVTVLAAAVVAPFLLRGLARLLDRRGTAAVLGSLLAARAARRTVPLVLAVSLAVGSVAFALIVRDSTAQARVARADYVAGADVRVTAPPSATRAGEEAEANALRDLPGVTAVTGVRRSTTFVDDLGADAVAVDLDAATAEALVGTEDPLPWRRLASEGDGPVPVAMTEPLASAAGLSLGDTLTLSVLGRSTEVELAALVPFVRTVPDGYGGVLVDAGALEAAGGPLDPPTEWWLDARDPDRVAAALAERPDLAARTQTRDGVLRQLEDDPATGGTALGHVLALTALGATVVGVLVLCSVLLLRRRERAAQARMVAVAGGDRRLLSGALTWELGLAGGTGLLAGLLAGAAVAAVTLSSLVLGTDGGPLVPAPELLVPWAWVLAATLAIVLLPVLALRFLVRRDLAPGLGEEGGR